MFAQARPYLLALTSQPDGSGDVEPLARFMTNPAGAQVVNAVGPIRQIVDPDKSSSDRRRYLAVTSVDDGRPGRVVQVQQPEIARSAADQ